MEDSAPPGLFNNHKGVIQGETKKQSTGVLGTGGNDRFHPHKQAD